MSTKITNNLKVHGESTTQKYTDAQYNTDTQRINGAQPGTPISSKLMNTGLRNATLVTSALIEALKTVVPNNNDLTTAITVGTDTTQAALVTALTEALVKIKVETAVLADNVKSGAIVEETTTARESKQGFGISLGLNSKLQFKTTWLGTHKNNDVLYYSVAGPLKGFYIVKGLSVETAEQAAGTLTITSGQTPTTHAANLQRLTFETSISVNTSLSKTDVINSLSTTNQLATAKAIWDYAAKVTAMPATPTDNQMPTAKLLKDYAQPLISAGTANDILIKTATAGVLSTLSKVTSLTSLRTNSDIPTAKAVYDYIETRKWQLIRDTTTWTTISTSTDTTTSIACTGGGFVLDDVLVFELANSGYTDRPFLVQAVLTRNNSNPVGGNILKAEQLIIYQDSPGAINEYVEIRHYLWFSYSDGINLRFKTIGSYGQYGSATAFRLSYKKDEYEDAAQNVQSAIGYTNLRVRRIWRIR